MSGASKQLDAGAQADKIQEDLPAQPVASQLPDGLEPVNTVPDDIESQLEDLEPLFDGPSPPHPHPHFSGRAPWLRAGRALAPTVPVARCLPPRLLHSVCRCRGC